MMYKRPFRMSTRLREDDSDIVTMTLAWWSSGALGCVNFCPSNEIFLPNGSRALPNPRTFGMNENQSALS
uniref:(California timema) hypothetical protein n=1 Tax=Timema californicum TaxID=61474 RepID=A0A7R9J3A3_TIMCA|nr:unnamed protein product [Timema californicum]